MLIIWRASPDEELHEVPTVPLLYTRLHLSSLRLFELCHFHEANRYHLSAFFATNRLAARWTVTNRTVVVLLRSNERTREAFVAKDMAYFTVNVGLKNECFMQDIPQCDTVAFV